MNQQIDAKVLENEIDAAPLVEAIQATTTRWVAYPNRFEP